MSLPDHVTKYRFLEKDPAIDLVRWAMEKTGMKPKELALSSHLHPSTIYAWDIGKTRRPQNMSMRMAMQAMGYTQCYRDANGKIVEADYETPDLKTKTPGDNVIFLRRRIG